MLEETPDVIALQELPRAAEGWTRTCSKNKLTLLQHRHPEAWRGLGLVFRNDLFSPVWKDATHHSLWTSLQHRLSGRRITLAAVHFDSGISNDELELQMAEVLACKPDKCGRLLIMGDTNVHLGWVADPDHEAIPTARGAKVQTLQSLFMRQGLRLVQQSNPTLPTFHSRKPGTRTTQIDAAFSTLPKTSGLRVLRDSRHIVGTDHELVILDVVGESPRPRKQRQARGPRDLCLPPDLGALRDSPITQQVLQEWSRSCTKPKSKPKFRLSPVAKELSRQAKRTRTAIAWKAYQHRVRQEHSDWQAQLAAQACSNWDTFKHVKHARKSQKVWAEGLARHRNDDPHKAVLDHFRETFHKHGKEVEQQPFQHLVRGISGVSAPLTCQEVIRAVTAGKNGRCPEPDNVPVELLKSICQQPRGPELLTQFYQNILNATLFPDEWHKAIVALLGKVDCPASPKDLRPIAVHSQVAQTFSRILLNRVAHRLAPQAPGQTCAPGRQACDYVWTLMRVCQLSLEWAEPLAALKLDISKAFDTIDRGRLASMLVDKLHDFPQECRCLLCMLLPAELLIATLWGEESICSNAGVKQGAVESPAFFAAAMEVILLGFDETRELALHWAL